MYFSKKGWCFMLQYCLEFTSDLKLNCRKACLWPWSLDWTRAELKKRVFEKLDVGALCKQCPSRRVCTWAEAHSTERETERGGGGRERMHWRGWRRSAFETWVLNYLKLFFSTTSWRGLHLWTLAAAQKTAKSVSNSFMQKSPNYLETPNEILVSGYVCQMIFKLINTCPTIWHSS